MRRRFLNSLPVLLMVLAFSSCAEEEVVPPTAEEICRNGYEHLKDGKLAEARAAFEKALEMKPRYAGAQMGIGAAWEEEDDFEEAVDAYSLAIEFNPEFAYAYYVRGLLLNKYSSDEDDPEGEEDLQMAYELDPTLKPLESGQLIIGSHRKSVSPWTH